MHVQGASQWGGEDQGGGADLWTGCRVHEAGDSCQSCQGDGNVPVQDQRTREFPSSSGRGAEGDRPSWVDLRDAVAGQDRGYQERTRRRRGGRGRGERDY